MVFYLLIEQQVYVKHSNFGLLSLVVYTLLFWLFFWGGDIFITYWSTPSAYAFSRPLDTHIYEVIDGDLFVLPHRIHYLQSWWLLPSSVEWYNILTNGVTLCSQIARLTLQRLTHKKSASWRSWEIPKGDAITLIHQGKRWGYLKSLGSLSGSLTWTNTLDGLIKKLQKHTHNSYNNVRDVYLQDLSSKGFNQGHRFVMIRWSDKQNYILDPVLWSGHAYPKPLWEYFTSIWEIKQGGILYLGRWYRAVFP